jgi:hypothetical protein
MHRKVLLFGAFTSQAGLPAKLAFKIDQISLNVTHGGSLNKTEFMTTFITVLESHWVQYVAKNRRTLRDLAARRASIIM